MYTNTQNINGHLTLAYLIVSCGLVGMAMCVHALRRRRRHHHPTSLLSKRKIAFRTSEQAFFSASNKEAQSQLTKLPNKNTLDFYCTLNSFYVVFSIESKRSNKIYKIRIRIK